MDRRINEWFRDDRLCSVYYMFRKFCTKRYAVTTITNVLSTSYISTLDRCR